MLNLNTYNNAQYYKMTEQDNETCKIILKNMLYKSVIMVKIDRNGLFSVNYMSVIVKHLG